jgi:putative endonuclease
MEGKVPRNERRAAGHQGEDVAAGYLRGLGWRIVARNLYFRVSEVDIWAHDGRQWVVVEVRSRWRGCSEQALASVTRTKQRRLALAASLLLQREGDPRASVRFDVLVVDLSRRAVTIHCRGAFEGGG